MGNRDERQEKKSAILTLEIQIQTFFSKPVPLQLLPTTGGHVGYAVRPIIYNIKATRR